MIDEETREIRTEDGPYLLQIGDVVAFPESSWCATVTKATDAGIRLEFIEWIAGSADHEEVWSWDQVFTWPKDDLRVFGAGYDLRAPTDCVQSRTRRRLAEQERAGTPPDRA